MGLLTVSIELIQTYLYYISMNKFISILQAAELLGVSTQTLRRWEKTEKLLPTHRTKGGQHRYDASLLMPYRFATAVKTLPTLAYARVSSHDQKEDLKRQVHLLEKMSLKSSPSFLQDYMDLEVVRTKNLWMSLNK